MAEYIEREAALQFVFDACTECMDACEEFDGIYADCNQCMLEGVKLKLRDLPAADVRPVVRGEWEKAEDFDEYGGGRHVEWTCSECFYIVKSGWAVRDSHIDEKPKYNFCPNCGADMREES